MFILQFSKFRTPSKNFMAYTYGRPFRYQKRRPSARGSAYRPTYSRSAMYPRRPAGSYSRYSRKKASRYARPKIGRKMVVTPKNGFVSGCALSQYQLSQIDAFDPRVVGVKIPDSNAAPSCGLMVSDDISLPVPGTTGFSCAFAFQPSTSTTMITAVPGSANSWTWPVNFGGNTASQKFAAVNNNFDLFRPVAHGVRISSSLAATAATGFVHIAVYPSRMTRGTWDFPLTLAAMADCMWYTRITVSSLTQTPYVIQNKFLDCTSQRYIDTNTSTGRLGDNPSTAGQNFAGASNIANEWCTVVIALEGANTTATLNNPISAETLVHYEALPAPLGVQAGGPAAAFDPRDMQGAAAISAQQNPVSPVSPEGQSSSILEGVIQAAQAAGNVAVDVARVAGPQTREAFVQLAGGAIGTYAAQRGAAAQNNIGMIQN